MSINVNSVQLILLTFFTHLTRSKIPHVSQTGSSDIPHASSTGSHSEGGNYTQPIWQTASITGVGWHPTGHRQYLLRFTNLTKNNNNWHVPEQSNCSGNTPIAAVVRQICKTQKYVDSRIEKSRPTLKRKRRHVREILVAGCTASYQKYKFQCSRWRKCPQNDISVPISSTYWWYCVQLNRWNTEWYFQKLGKSSVTYTTQ